MQKNYRRAAYWLMLAGIVFAAGWFTATRTNQSPAQEWCDARHTVPYVPAAQCEGLSSCDRWALTHEPVDCSAILK